MLRYLGPARGPRRGHTTSGRCGLNRTAAKALRAKGSMGVQPAQGGHHMSVPRPRAEAHLGLCGHLTGQCWIFRLDSNTVW